MMTPEYLDSMSTDHLERREEDKRARKREYAIAGSLAGGLFLVLTIGIACLASILGTSTDITPLETALGKATPLIEKTAEDMRLDLLPKTDLVLKSLSTTLPGELRSMTASIITQVSRSCSDSISTGGGSQSVPIHHDQAVKPYSANTYWRCNAGAPQVNKDVPLANYKFLLEATLPTAVNAGGCMRIPSFSLSPTVYAYAVNSIQTGCRDESISDQILQIGTVQITSTQVPKLVNLRTRTFPSTSYQGFVRKSCSVAAHVTQVFMLCGSNGQGENEPENYKSLGYPGFSLDILDITGAVTSHRYTSAEVGFGNMTTAAFPAVGSGTLWRGRVYFLLYGGTRGVLNDTALCFAPGCTNPSQVECNKAIKSTYLGGCLIWNALLAFTPNVDPKQKPTLSVYKIPYSKNWMGAEGRLMTVDERMYIYKRSSDWHALAQAGEILRDDPFEIRWTTITTSSRPGAGTCSASNRCPKPCLTGVYLDIFPISHGYGVFSQVQELDGTQRRNPTVVYSTATDASLETRWPLDSTAHPYGYTSTTCLTVNETGYCLHILESGGGSLNEFSIIAVGSRIPKKCP